MLCSETVPVQRLLSGLSPAPFHRQRNRGKGSCAAGVRAHPNLYPGLMTPSASLAVMPMSVSHGIVHTAATWAFSERRLQSDAPAVVASRNTYVLPTGPSPRKPHCSRSWGISPTRGAEDHEVMTLRGDGVSLSSLWVRPRLADCIARPLPSRCPGSACPDQAWGLGRLGLSGVGLCLSLTHVLMISLQQKVQIRVF